MRFSLASAMMTNTVAPSERTEEAAPALGPSAITNEMELANEPASASHSIGLGLGVFDLAIRPSIAQELIVHASRKNMAMACDRPRSIDSDTYRPRIARIPTPHAPNSSPTDHHASAQIRVFGVAIWIRLTSKLSCRAQTHHARWIDDHQNTSSSCAWYFISHAPLQRELGPRL
jgi:hypothetical protein